MGLLWPNVLKNNLEIIFAYNTFQWQSEAKGKAYVHVVIIGLAKTSDKKQLFNYDNDNLIEKNPKYISPYLFSTEQPLSIVKKTSKAINGLPKMIMGTTLIDNGNYTFTNKERSEFLSLEPNAKPYLRPYVSGEDFINGIIRWILVLYDIEPNQLQKLPETLKRIEAVKQFRKKRKRHKTQKMANTPTLFDTTVIPDRPFLAIPTTSSEKRNYIPIGYLKPPIIPSNETRIIKNASLGLFGILTSRMHMVWLRMIGGKLKSDLRYSIGVVYNTFPVPDKELDVLEPYTQKILDVRKKYPNSTLVDLYDSLKMPDKLLKAHKSLDKAVEKLYRKKPFESDTERLEFLLGKYQKMIDKNQTCLC